MGHSPWIAKSRIGLSMHTSMQVYMKNSEGKSPVLPFLGCMVFHCMDKPEFI